MVKQIKKATSETIEFLKRLAILVAGIIVLAIAAGGIATALEARQDSITITTIAALVSGAFTAITALIVMLPKVLKHKVA